MEPLDIVFVISNENNARMLGCYGHKTREDPAHRRLGGVGDAHLYVLTHMCARASETGYWDNAPPYVGQVPGWRHCLQTTGHWVVSIGKLHYGNKTDPTGLDKQILPMHVKDGRGGREDGPPWVRAIRKVCPYDDYMGEEKRRVAVTSYFGICSFMETNVFQTGEYAQFLRALSEVPHRSKEQKRRLGGRTRPARKAAETGYIRLTCCHIRGYAS